MVINGIHFKSVPLPSETWKFCRSVEDHEAVIRRLFQLQLDERSNAHVERSSEQNRPSPIDVNMFYVLITMLNYVSENGALLFGLPEEMSKYVDAINQSGISARVITAQEAKEKFPSFKIPRDDVIIFDPVGGVLVADLCLKALLVRS